MKHTTPTKQGSWLIYACLDIDNQILTIGTILTKSQANSLHNQYFRNSSLCFEK